MAGSARFREASGGVESCASSTRAMEGLSACGRRGAPTVSFVPGIGGTVSGGRASFGGRYGTAIRKSGTFKTLRPLVRKLWRRGSESTF